jgi:hypothetical protein
MRKRLAIARNTEFRGRCERKVRDPRAEALQIAQMITLLAEQPIPSLASSSQHAAGAMINGS